ncbi:tRNA (guanosine(46)-N7)-methyltransferase TrmB [Roseospira marina]|uniref:tRNA (guanine-N(7)-)-methyltransferase n=1 Tax=Roseospira marina TaxID=140057 RepID=A0A5M6IAT6_9PROT|nr:tRNA (guanosine(46)-N7)-methyltransferase TrmB [Roseospira marina]KAA5605390.1 tRNA (guanosine(46)-N7)-methyltransferase TrmB [Roseospira marina]MBB4314623.1 tRNA (guanine-N7-)-methyltransferase [Roseospira marina]MBB5088772.1 tRNA (guanine-N7-)-methyltransferase [Roseospira marina]
MDAHETAGPPDDETGGRDDTGVRTEDVRFYGRRKGKPLRAGRQAVMDRRLPDLAFAAPAPETVLDPRTLFPDPVQAVWLEIGFGGGEHLAAQAAAHPDVGLIGAEVFEYGIAKLVAAVDEAGLTNVRVYPDDIRPVLEHLPDAGLDRIFVLFPDPWPKSRHAKRRMIAPHRLDLFGRLLVDGGRLRVASDDMGYIRWTLRHAVDHPAFTWAAQRADDWRQPPADHAPTRYEAKALEQGRRPVYLDFIRRPRTGT